MPFCVGMTGGVGSGKSTVADCFAGLGAAVVDTDLISRTLTARNGVALPAIAAAFDSDVVSATGGLNRTALRAIVFTDPLARKRLEAILHPLIRAESARLVAGAGANAAPYVLLVVPLLVENLAAYRAILDRILVVDCDEQQQVARTASRAGVDEAQARAILAAQSPREARLAIADDVIDNRYDLAALHHHVHDLHQRYLRMADRAVDPGPTQ